MPAPLQYPCPLDLSLLRHKPKRETQRRDNKRDKLHWSGELTMDDVIDFSAAGLPAFALPKA